MYTHRCIKPNCAKNYEDTDPDAYYCPSCNEERKAVAREVDARLGARTPEQPMTALQEYDAAQKVHGFMQVRL